jgi:aspartate racemase
MSEERCLGLIGGLGVGAAVYYYRWLAEAHEKAGRRLNLVMVHAETPVVFEHAERDDRDGLARYMNSFILRLKAAGAEIVAIPAVTPHFCVRELMEISPLPVLNIFEPLMVELSARSVRRAAIFGTKFVINSNLFGMVDPVEIVPWQAEEVDTIHRNYVELARIGRGTDEQYRELSELAAKIRDRDNVEAILLAGTDLAILFNESNTNFPSMDCAALHLKWIAKQLLGEASR